MRGKVNTEISRDYEKKKLKKIAKEEKMVDKSEGKK